MSHGQGMHLGNVLLCMTQTGVTDTTQHGARGQDGALQQYRCLEGGWRSRVATGLGGRAQVQTPGTKLGACPHTPVYPHSPCSAS